MLLGEAIVGFAWRAHHFHVSSLPKGLHPIPGPIVILAERFIDSPIGPYTSLSFGEPVRLGIRPGYFFGVSVLNSPEARRVGRQTWGFPHELGTLHWLSEAGHRSVEWEEGGISVNAKSSGRAKPFLIPMRMVQRRTDGPVIVPNRLRAMARGATVEVEAFGKDLEGLNGTHRGMVLSGMVLRRNPARRAHGLLSTLRAPLRAPEPGVAGMVGRRCRSMVGQSA